MSVHIPQVIVSWRGSEFLCMAIPDGSPRYTSRRVRAELTTSSNFYKYVVFKCGHCRFGVVVASMNDVCLRCGAVVSVIWWGRDSKRESLRCGSNPTLLPPKGDA